MRALLLTSSLIALAAALMLLVADSMPYCERMEDVRADWDYELVCDGVLVAEGSVSFSNAERNWQFEVEAAADSPADRRPLVGEPKRVGEEESSAGEIDSEEPGETQVHFVVARTEVDSSDCEPGAGISRLELAIAEAGALWEENELLFACPVYPLEESVTCDVGPVVWPGPDGTFDDTSHEHDLGCSLILAAATGDSDR